MANDGKVIISTELDNSGIEKGLDKISGMLGGMKSVLKEIADAVVTAFAFSRIVDFAVESSQAAMTLSDALNGLQSILDGQGRSFSAAQAFIEEYTKDGLIPATNAITAYKNLAMRGYDDSQIQQVMQALKDASAYGRQASFTMGEAVESATEGLKNENSILVDNAGVTKNVAKMWEEYAASIGTTANNLTQQQKIQAEVTGILEESKYQAGDAATVAGTLSGQLQQLSFNFNNLKVAVGNAINPFVQTVLPIINSVIIAFAQAKDSGQFDGPAGPQGEAGPAGAPGKDYVLTDADRAEIAEQAAGLVEVPESGGIEVTGASVGQIIVVKAVDDNGKPTEWETADLPQGGGGETAAEAQLATGTIEEGTAAGYIDTGVTLATLKKYKRFTVVFKGAVNTGASNVYLTFSNKAQYSLYSIARSGGGGWLYGFEWLNIENSLLRTFVGWSGNPYRLQRWHQSSGYELWWCYSCQSIFHK